MPNKLIDTFTGGLTDAPIGALDSQYEVADNLDLTDSGKLKTRMGNTLYDSTNYIVDTAAGRIRLSNCWVLDDVLFMYSYRNIYYYSSGWTKITGPTGNAAFPNATTTSKVSVDIWNHHAFLVCDSFDLPIKVYNDATRGWSLRSAGLPYFLGDPSPDQYLRANHLLETMRIHFVDEAQHTTAPQRTAGTTNYTATNYFTSYNFDNMPRAKDVDSFIEIVNWMRAAYANHNADSEAAAGWLYHNAQQAVLNTADLASTARVNTFSDAVTAMDDIYTKLLIHSDEDTQHAGAGVVAVSRLSARSLSGRSYIWSSHFKYSYTIGSRTFTDYGPVQDWIVPNTAEVTKTASTDFGHLPTIQNFTEGNYDVNHVTGRVTVEMFRTVDGGKVGYRLGNIKNFVEVYTDDQADSALQKNIDTLYTTGGRVSNDPPPKCKFFTIANNCGWYANVEDENEVLRPNQLRQSVQDDIDAVPYDFLIEFDDDINGLSSVGIYPIVTCEQKVFRVEGVFDEFGSGGLFKRLISDVAGNKSNLGMVKIQDGMVWLGNEGIYFTDGFKVQLISKDYKTNYQTFILSSITTENIYGTYDKENQRVYWCVQNGASNSENDTILVLHLRFGFGNGRFGTDGVFTTYSGTNFRPTSIVKFGTDIVIGTSKGFVLKMNSSQVKDSRFDSGALPSAWGTQHVAHNYEGPALALGDPERRKWASKVRPMFKVTDSTTAILPRHEIDDSGTKTNQKEIRFGGTSKPYVSETRNYTTGKLRCYYKQQGFIGSNTILYNSDTYGRCTIAAGNTSRTLTYDFTNSWYWSYDTAKLQIASGTLKNRPLATAAYLSYLKLQTTLDETYGGFWTNSNATTDANYLSDYDETGLSIINTSLKSLPVHLKGWAFNSDDVPLYTSTNTTSLIETASIRFCLFPYQNYRIYGTNVDNVILRAFNNAQPTRNYIQVSLVYSAGFSIVLAISNFNGGGTDSQEKALVFSMSDNSLVTSTKRHAFYDVEVGFSSVTGKLYIAINGDYTEWTHTLVRTAGPAPDRLRIGCNGANKLWDVGLRDVVFGTAPMHTASFYSEAQSRWQNPYPVSEEITATAENTFYTAEITSFTATVTGNVRFILEIDGTKKYISGGAVTTSTGAYSQATSATDWNSNLAALTTFLSTGKTIKVLVVFNSSPTAEASIDTLTIVYKFGNSGGTVKEISLDNHPTNTWPSDITDYYLTTETDTYTLQHQILERIDGQKIAVLLNTTLDNASAKKWQIHGKRKGDVMELLNYDVQYELLPGGHQHYDGTTGGNA